MENSFTYEHENIRQKLETYEWENNWCERAYDTEAQRVLYIGDSISCGIRRFATAASDNQILFDGFGTSKALDNPFYTKMLRLFAQQQGYRSIVLFNNGLHGWHLDDEVSYPMYFRKMLDFLKTEFSDTPIAVVLSTAVTDPVRLTRIIKRNAVAEQAAKEYGSPVIDLFSVSESHSKLHTDDGIHFVEEGYRQLAQIVYKSV